MDALEPLVPVLVRLLEGHVEVGVGLLRRQVDHVELGVDVNQTTLNKTLITKKQRVKVIKKCLNFKWDILRYVNGSTHFCLKPCRYKHEKNIMSKGC